MLKNLIDWQTHDPKESDGVVARTELGNFVYEIIEASPDDYHLMEYNIAAGESYRHDTPADATIDDLKKYLINHRMEPIL